MEARQDALEHTPMSYSSTDALAALLLILSHTFSYPSLERARWHTSTGFVSRVCELASLADVDTAGLLAYAASFAPASPDECDAYAHALRVEHTRLFIVTPRHISLTGTRWVRQPVSLSRRQSERVLVQRAYNELNLRNQAGVNEPADHIVSELDYAAYVTGLESAAWKGGDAANAQEWKLLRDEFLANHLADLAFGVADAIEALSVNDHLKGHAALLKAVMQRCLR